MNKHNLIAVDLAKDIFQVCGLTTHQKIVFNRSLNRNNFAEFMANHPPVDVAMEACYSSHYWARHLQAMGHKVRLLPAQHVAPFVRGNKSDRNDALAIGEAARRPNILPVPIKTIEQSDIQCLHRLRERHVSHRTGLINQARGLLSEYGLIAPKGLAQFARLLHQVTQTDDDSLSPLLKEQFVHIADEYRYHSERIKALTQTLSRIARAHPYCQILLSIPGIGPINATAIVSAIGNGSQFNSGREFAVWLGLTPRQSSSGHQSSSGGITKRGNRYLRKQLVHGARAVLFRSTNKNDRLNHWINQLVARRGAPKSTVALAARMARIAWVLLNKQVMYRANF